MLTFIKYFLGFLATASLCIISFFLIKDGLVPIGSAQKPVVDYVNVVVILLAAVTVILTIFAILMAVLGFFGFDELKRRAAKYAETAADKKIDEKFSNEGFVQSRIDAMFLDPTQEFRGWLEQRIQISVIEAVPFMQAGRRLDDNGMDRRQPTDEGDID